MYSLLSHLNTLFLGIDGCFKTKLKNRGITDPDLGTGLAYMVNDGDYADHLEATAGVTPGKVVSADSPCFALANTLITLGRLRTAARTFTP